MSLLEQLTGFVIWCMNAPVFRVLVAKECRRDGPDWQFLRQVSPTQSHQSDGAVEKAISTVRDVARTYSEVLKDKIASVDVTPESPIMTWTIRRAA